MAYINVNNLENTLNKIYYGSVKYKLRVYVNGTELENVDSYCEGMTIKHSIVPNGSKVFSLNSLISKEIEITLHDLDLSLLYGKINISIDIPVGENEIETIPIGVFNIEDKPTNDKDRTSITLRDNSVLLDHPYNAQPLIQENGGSATKLQIFQDICTQFGIETDIEHFDNDSDEIGIYDSTVNARIYICYLAEQAGCIPSFDREGKLIFLDINDLYTWTLPYDLLEKYENGDSYKISRVVYEDAIRKFESGEETYDTLYLDSADPYISNQDQVDDIYDKVKDFEINSITTGMIIGNPLIDGYDLITFTNNDDETFTTLASYELRYSGVLTNTFSTQIGLEERTENVTLNGEPSFRRFAKTNIDNINNNITMIVAEQNEQGERLTQVQQDVNSIQNLFQITGGNNMIKDSQLLLKDEGLWNYSSISNYSFFPSSGKYPMTTRNPIEYYYREPTYICGYDSTLIGKTVAIAKIGISNGKMSTTDVNITNLIIGNMYTLSYKISNDENTNSKVKLIGQGNVIYEEDFNEELYMQERTYSFVAQTSNYKLEIQSTSTTEGFVYVYDLMLNKGDVQSWQPASGEIVSTTVKLSQLGVQVFSDNSEIATIMTTEGFNIYRYQNGYVFTDDPITTFNKDGFRSKLGMLEMLDVNGYSFKTVTYQGYQTLVLYKRESDI